MPELIDTHCHLSMEVFREDLDRVLESALGQGISKIIVPGVDPESSQKAVELASRYSCIYAAVGIHPEAVDSSTAAAIKTILELAHEPKVVAIGEIGLDFFYTQENQTQQINLFTTMLEIAKNVEKPVIVHSRNAIMETLRFLETWISSLIDLHNPNIVSNPGILHAFEGDLEQAKKAASISFALGAGGPITYKNAHLKQEVFTKIPLSSIVLETDSPYLPPHPHRGTRNEPARLKIIAEKLSELKNSSIEEIMQNTTQNANHIFSWN